MCWGMQKQGSTCAAVRQYAQKQKAVQAVTSAQMHEAVQFRWYVHECGAIRLRQSVYTKFVAVQARLTTLEVECDAFLRCFSSSSLCSEPLGVLQNTVCYICDTEHCVLFPCCRMHWCEACWSWCVFTTGSRREWRKRSQKWRCERVGV